MNNINVLKIIVKKMESNKGKVYVKTFDRNLPHGMTDLNLKKGFYISADTKIDTSKSSSYFLLFPLWDNKEEILRYKEVVTEIEYEERIKQILRGNKNDFNKRI